MKIASVVVSIIFSAFTGIAQQFHDAKITIHVVDENDSFVTNAPVSTSVLDHYRMGSEWGEEPVYKRITVLTDAGGIVVMAASKAPAKFQYVVMDMPGFYLGGGEFSFKESSVGRWQPWNPTVKLVLKRIINPVPMYARKVAGQKIPVQGAPAGFDLMAGDWVAPYGKGQFSDFVFQLDRKVKTTTNSEPNLVGIRTWTEELYDATITLTFNNEGDGIQMVPADSGSLFRLPRLATTNDYQPELSKRAWIDRGTNKVIGTPTFAATFIKGHSDYNKDANYFFRIRTKKDASGNIVSALYGKIYGDFGENIGHEKIDFTYYLNPTPNDRNMEFDPKQNLFLQKLWKEYETWKKTKQETGANATDEKPDKELQALEKAKRDLDASCQNLPP